MAESTPANAQWSSRSVGKPWQHQFFYIVIRLLGRSVAYAVLRVIVLWYAVFSRSARARCAPYLAHRFPQRRGYLRRTVDCYRWQVGLGEALIDRAAFGLSQRHKLEVLCPDGQKLIDLLSEGKGLIIINSHVGCWQLAVSALKFLDTPVNVAIFRDAGDIDRHYYEHSGQERPFGVINPNGYLGGTLEMLGALKRREVLGVTGDRIMGDPRNAIEVNFLGGRVKLPSGAYRLSAVDGTPIAVLLSHKHSRHEYVIEVAEVIRVEATSGKKPANLQPYAQLFADALEKYVADYPWQFFNFYDMWESPPVSAEPKAKQ